MNQEQFLSVIYSELKVGMKVLIPKRKTDIVKVQRSGNIVYRIADAYDKVLTKQELIRVYEHLENGSLNDSALREIASPSRTCNVSTIKWILSRFSLAHQNQNKYWVKAW